MNVDGDEAFVSASEYETVKVRLEDTTRALFLVNEENKQLKEALSKINQFHKASEEPVDIENVRRNGNIIIKVETWRRCRELAMDLLHIPVGGEELQLIIKLENGYLRGIKQK